MRGEALLPFKGLCALLVLQEAEFALTSLARVARATAAGPPAVPGCQLRFDPSLFSCREGRPGFRGCARGMRRGGPPLDLRSLHRIYHVACRRRRERFSIAAGGFRRADQSVRLAW